MQTFANPKACWAGELVGRDANQGQELVLICNEQQQSLYLLLPVFITNFTMQSVDEFFHTLTLCVSIDNQQTHNMTPLQTDTAQSIIRKMNIG